MCARRRSHFHWPPMKVTKARRPCAPRRWQKGLGAKIASLVHYHFYSHQRSLDARQRLKTLKSLFAAQFTQAVGCSSPLDSRLRPPATGGSRTGDCLREQSDRVFGRRPGGEAKKSASPAGARPGQLLSKKKKGPSTTVPRPLSKDNEKAYWPLMPSSSTSKFNVAFGGITPPAPRAP